MCQKSALILLFMATLCNGAPSIRRPSDRYNYATSFDYDYGVDDKVAARNPQQTSPWTSITKFMSNMRLPSLRWNPLASIFNMGATVFMDTPVLNWSSTSSAPKRRTTKKKITKSKGTKGSKNRRRPPQKQQDLYQYEEADLEQPVEDYDQLSAEQVVHQSSQVVDNSPEMYFLDPYTQQYYVVKRLQFPVQPIGEETAETESDYQDVPAEQPLKGEVSESDDEAAVETKDDSLTKVESEQDAKSVRNAIGAFMKDDQLNKRRQQVANPNEKTLTKQKPRKIYYVLSR